MKKYIIAFTLTLVMLFGTVGAYAADPNVTVVNPAHNTTITSNNLCISVKITETNKTIALKLVRLDKSGDEMTETTIKTDDPYTTEKSLEFHVVPVNDLSPGIYKIVVDTTSASGETDNTTTFFLLEKKSNGTVVFDSNKGSLQDFIKSFFGN